MTSDHARASDGHPEHDSVIPALEDEPTPDEPAGRSGDPAAVNAGDDELNSGRYEPGAPQAGA